MTGKEESRIALRFISWLVEYMMIPLTEIKDWEEEKGFMVKREMVHSHLNILSLRCLSCSHLKEKEAREY